MPVLSRCPLCRGVMSNVRGESRCPRCGELVLPAVRKLCAGCGADVTRTKRARDASGEYFCHDCWAAQLAVRGEEPGYVCHTCRKLFPTDRVYQDGDELICVDCYQQRNLDPDALLEVASHVGDEAPAVFAPAPPRRRSTGVPWGWVVAGIAVLAATIGAAILMGGR